jgi:hypothetical protein
MTEPALPPNRRPLRCGNRIAARKNSGVTKRSSFRDGGRAALAAGQPESRRRNGGSTSTSPSPSWPPVAEQRSNYRPTEEKPQFLRRGRQSPATADRFGCMRANGNVECASGRRRAGVSPSGSHHSTNRPGEG